ncbi:hypothetical protein C9I49_23990 [Pseudomonas prosekii]|uniref:Uncharacterized protein n=1 Tax=Pseudomonas prosekii TaxID=1148509 RepID=A0A2U2D262_9PSED|nr:hypothetical protein C9I49_23990 [Pseudomonas prosekii]
MFERPAVGFDRHVTPRGQARIPISAKPSTPWCRPLGGVMRVLKPSYEMSAGFRAEHNGCPIREPR